MQLRSARFRRAFQCPAQSHILPHCLPAHVPITAGHSYATAQRSAKGGYKKPTPDDLKFERSLIKRTAPYTLDDVPPLTDLEAMLQHPAAPAYLKGMTAAQAHGILTEFAQRKLARLEARRTRSLGLQTDWKRRTEWHHSEAMEWPWVLEGLQRGDPANKPAVLATLHSVACVLLFTPGVRQWNIALGILSDLGRFEMYAPSDLTMVRLAQSSNRLDSATFALAIERVTTGRVHCDTDSDRANYETLRGLICASGSPKERAARDALWWFQQALDPQKGRRAPGAFDWQAACMVEMGRCYKRVGDTKNAVRLWETAARELDNPHATSMFATAAMDRRDPRTEEWLTRAALGGDRAAQSGLARVQKAKWEDAEAGGVKGWELTFRKVMKDEWESLAKGMP